MNDSNSSVDALPDSCQDARRLLLLAEQDRHRLSHLLHSDVGQLLTAVVLNLEYWRGTALPELERAASVEELKRALEMIRGICLATRSTVIDCGGLIQALRTYCASCAQGTSLKVVFNHSTSTADLPLALEIATFQILKCAIDNVVHHAGAREMKLNLTTCEGLLSASVEDDGAGFDVALVVGRNALGGMRRMQRIASAIGGVVTIESAQDRGCSVRVSLPLGNPTDC